MTALATDVAAWVTELTFADLPDDVVASTRLRLLDVMGLSLAGLETAFGEATRAAAVAMTPGGASRIFGSGDRVAPMTAAFANAAFSQALEYDDTHNESIVHMSSPAVAAALALSETMSVSGRDLVLAIALANEISCRVGCVAPGQFHRLGFHPTALFAPFGITCLAGKLLGLNVETLAHALGTCGSTAAGLLECWVDGTETKFLHSGFAAQNGIAAALLAQAGVSGPPAVFEGRFGLFASHLQDGALAKHFGRITGGLGDTWDSRNSSFKPYPAAHVLHPYLDALLRVREQHGLRPEDVIRIECPVAAFIVSIVCEPADEKCQPATQAHGRVSLQYTLAEALYRGRLGKDAYEAYEDPEIRALASRVTYHVDPTYPGPGRFKGAVRLTLRDGRVIEDVQEYNRGSAENPMTDAELRAKFDENAGGVLPALQRERLADAILRVDDLPDARQIVDLAVA
jgi:2-methylcitrate dehydratase PrpD